MKAHAMRRSIWFLNVGLMAALVGVGAWWFLDIREAVASAPKPVGPKHKAPQPYLGMVRAFNKDLENARTDVLSAPVKKQALDKVLLREDYEQKNPTHFIFTGRLPPTEVKRVDTTTIVKKKLPTGLDAMGKIDWLIYDGGDPSATPDDVVKAELYPDAVAANTTMVVFRFKSNEVGYFVIGEFVKEKSTEPDRFKLVGARDPEEGLYKIAYEVWGEDKEEPESTGEIEWDNRKGGAPGEGDVIYINPASIEVTEEPGSAETGGAADGHPAPKEPVDDKPEFVQPETVKPVSDLTREDLNPKIKDVNSSLVAIEFDDNTNRYFSRKGAKEMAESIKTQVAKDKLGNTIGLRLMDSGDAPADVLKIRRGDIIVSVDGQPVKERADIVRIAEGMREDTSRVTVVVDRNGRKITYQIDPRDNATRRAAGAYAGRELK